MVGLFLDVYVIYLIKLIIGRSECLEATNGQLRQPQYSLQTNPRPTQVIRPQPWLTATNSMATALKGGPTNPLYLGHLRNSI